MRHMCSVGLAALVAGSVALLNASAANPAQFEHHETVQGIDIYYGIVPGDKIRAYPQESPEAKMHGGVPRGQHHLMVSLFDAKTRQRIENARVTARVGELGLGVQEKPLEPMGHPGGLAYGNYFRMAGSGPYRITVRIRTAGSPRVIEGSAHYSRSRF